jgi:hypothetical protein
MLAWFTAEKNQITLLIIYLKIQVDWLRKRIHNTEIAAVAPARQAPGNGRRQASIASSLCQGQHEPGKTKGWRP